MPMVGSRIRCIRRSLSTAGLTATLVLAGCTHAVEESDWQDHFQVETVHGSVDRAWALAFQPDDASRALLTERRGALFHIDTDSGDRRAIDGLPDIAAVGQGGLLDVAFHPDYPETEWIYLTYSAEGDEAGRYATHLARARLAPDAEALEDFEVLHVATPFVRNTGHFGSRIVVGGDGYIHYTSGDRRDRDAAQDLGSHHGKTLRVREDGTIPDDNPFVDGDGAKGAIWSYGHRNPQGLTLHPETGALWSHEHGQRAGDEVNVIERGGNYGWPVATWGREYTTGGSIGKTPDESEDTVAPIHYWSERSYPPSGMAFYKGDAFPDWDGALLIGVLGREYLGYLVLDGGNADARALNEGALLTEEGWRVRDVRVRPDDGTIYVLIDADDAPLVRLVPRNE